MVAKNHADSNYKLAKDGLLSKVDNFYLIFLHAVDLALVFIVYTLLYCRFLLPCLC